MTRLKSKPVSIDGIKHACEQGHVTTKSCKDRAQERAKDGYRIRDIDRMDAISMEVAHCTAFYSRNEALQVVASMVKAGHRQWGDEFLSDVRGWVEAVDAQ